MATASQQQQNEELKSRLIKLARNVIREKGMTALTLRSIAEQGETSTQAIYTLFGSKERLIQEVYRHWVVELETLLQVSAISSPEELMIKTARIYRIQALSDPELFRAGAAASAAEADILGMMYRSPTFALFSSFLEMGMQAGMFRKTEIPAVTAQTLWSAVHGAVLFEVTGSSDNRGNLVEELIPILLNGLR